MASSFFKSLLPFLSSFCFLFSPYCNSDAQTTKKEEVAENDSSLPTRRDLRGAFRKKQALTFVYPDGAENVQFYQPRIEAISNNRRFNVKTTALSASEVTETILKENILFLVGNFGSNELITEFFSSLPFEKKAKTFTFDQKKYHSKEDIFKLTPYPNPYNPQLPVYILTGNDDQQVRKFMEENYPLDLTRMFWSSWGYQVFQQGDLKVSGNFNDATWEMDKVVHFDFSNQNDTLLQTDHFRFIAHHAQLTKETVSKIAEQCETSYQALLKFVNAPKNLPIIDYHFYPSVEKKGLQQASMKEASVNFEENKISVVMNDNFQGSYAHPEHKLVLRKVYGTPALNALEDGLAIRFTQKWQKKGYQHWAKKLFDSGNLPPLKELLNNEIYQEESELVMGAMAGVFADFLITHLGKNKFIDQYKNGEVKELERLEEVFHTYLTTLEVPVISKEERRNSDVTYLKGFNFAHEGYRVFNGYGSDLAKQSLVRLTEIGSNAVAIVPYSFMRNPNKPAPIPIHQGAGGENDQAVLFAHFEAQKLGMHTMLKPQIWLGRSWPGDVEMKNEQDWAAFFDYYYRWTRHYALLAEINDFDSYCIGVEFAKATLAREQEWRSLIRKLKGIYSGYMTYAANWGKEFENLSFWDELDFIGLNCYYPLSKSDNPSKAELKNSFNKTLQKAEAVCKKYNKTLVFTEIGFRSVTAPWKNPHSDSDGRAFNDTHQKLCYEVVFEGIEDKDWCGGTLWWKWPSYMTHRGKNHVGFAPNKKQTEKVIENFFKTKN